jgi:hypothetical protein
MKKLITKATGIKATVSLALLSGYCAAQAQSSGFGSNPSNISGPSITAISNNVSSNMGGVAKGFESFLYLLGAFFIVVFIMMAWKYKKSEGREGNVGVICAALVLSVCSFAAPTLVGSASVSIFGSGARTGVAQPSVSVVP